MIFLFFNFLATFFLVGLIWIVQRVVYPSLGEVGESAFVDYHRGHMRRITPVVFPLMVVELLTGVALVVVPAGPFYESPLAWAGLLLTLVTWGSTAVLQVPLHRRLMEKGRDEVALRVLVRSNWIRTASWTLKAILSAWVLWGMMTSALDA